MMASATVAFVSEPEAKHGGITIAIADDHQVVRAGLRLLLQGEPDMHVVGEAGDAQAALRMVGTRRPDVLVLDLNMPGMPSLAALPDLLEQGTRVVVLTMQNDPAFARQALQAGASAFVLKEAASEELVTAVRAAAEGRTYLNPELGARLAATPPEPSGRPGDLTERETEILRLLALGHTNAEISQQLFLSVRTVETHRAAIQRKLGVTTRAELVRYALDHNLVE
jgi:two-component system response regulator NreC